MTEVNDLESTKKSAVWVRVKFQKMFVHEQRQKHFAECSKKASDILKRYASCVHVWVHPIDKR